MTDVDVNDDEKMESDDQEEGEMENEKEDEKDGDGEVAEVQQQENGDETSDDEKKSDDKGKQESDVQPTKTEDEKKGDEKEEQKKEEDLVVAKRCKPMSLLPIPSFYAQDLKRIRFIHADLMASSIHEHARRRITEVTNDYNRAFRTSSEIYKQRLKMQSEMNTITHQHRLEISKMKNEFAMQVTIARARWQKRKESWERQQAQKALQGMFGQMPVGTSRTQSASRHPNQIYNTVGLALGRVVDAVIMKVEGGLDSGEKFEDFVPPPTPNFDNLVANKNTGETFLQRSQRIDATVRRELQKLSSRLQQSEDERKRAWRKLIKTKNEFEMPIAGRRRLDPNQINQVSMPPLNGSGGTIAPVVNFPAPSIPVQSFAPTIVNKPQPGMVNEAPGARFLTLAQQSESKYSAARVRERISSDGTVAPVSEPKRDKDGLFMRPAGRTRKGMSWDAVRGIWVPADIYLR